MFSSQPLGPFATQSLTRIEYLSHYSTLFPMSQDTNKPIDLEKGGSQETVAGILPPACRCRRKS